MMKKFIIFILSLIIQSSLWSQASKAAQDTNQSIDFGGYHFAIALLLAFLLIPLFVTGRIFISLAKNKFREQMEKKYSNRLSLFLLAPVIEAPQAMESSTFIDFANLDWGLWIMLFVALVEISLITFFTIQISNILNLSSEKSSEEETESSSALSRFWDKINSFKPLKEEHAIDTGHNYDGIRELNNVTPPWFTYSFIATIIFAGIYLYRYHWAESAPLQIQELKTEMDIALQEKMLYASLQENNIDENNVSFLGEADQQQGQVIFESKCAVCHEKNAASKPGGVGPNLTDDYWLHGGKISDIFYTVKYGWPEKGMISWSDQLSPLEMAQVSSYIKAQHGKNIAGGKEAQGELFKEEIKPATETKVDTTKK